VLVLSALIFLTRACDAATKYLSSMIFHWSIENIRHLKGSSAFPLHHEAFITSRSRLSWSINATHLHLAAAVGVKLIVESPVRPSRQTCAAPKHFSAGQQKEEESFDRLDFRKFTVSAPKSRFAKTAIW